MNVCRNSLILFLLISFLSATHPAAPSYLHLAPQAQFQNEKVQTSYVQGFFNGVKKPFQMVRQWSLKRKIVVSISAFFLTVLIISFVFFPNYAIGFVTGLKYKIKQLYVQPTRKNIKEVTSEINEMIQSQDSWYEITVMNAVDFRRHLIEKGKFSKQAVAEILQLSGKTKEIYLKYGVLVEGATPSELIIIESLLQNLPQSHVQGLHAIVVGITSEEALGRYLPFYKKGIIVLSCRHSKSNVKAVLAHEMGHKVWFYNMRVSEKLHYLNLFNKSSESEDFATEYSQTNVWEDFAEHYWLWLQDSQKVLNGSTSSILKEKITSVAKQFIYQKENQIYLCAYKNYEVKEVYLGETSSSISLAQLERSFKKNNVAPPVLFFSDALARSL